MTETSRPAGYFVVPNWWEKPAFSLTQISDFLKLPPSSVHYYITLAKAKGVSICAPFSCHDLLPLVLIVFLRRTGIRVNADHIAAAFAFVGGSTPRPIGHDELWAVFDGDGATVTVQAWLAWTAVRAFATKKFGTSHD